MALVRLNLYSESLEMDTDVTIFFPKLQPMKPGEDADIPRYEYGMKWQVLWLVHGGTGNSSDWSRKTMLEEYAEKYGLVIVMPTIRDCMGNLIHRGNSMKWMAEELPEILRFWFPLSDKREDNFIAGISFGGYFCYRTALNYPWKYSCAGSFSSPLDVILDYKFHPQKSSKPPVETIAGSEYDIPDLARRQLERGVQLPRLFQAVGTGDFTWHQNISARKIFRELGLELTWYTGPGIHNYEFWNEYGKIFLGWLPLRNQPFFPEEA